MKYLLTLAVGLLLATTFTYGKKAGYENGHHEGFQRGYSQSCGPLVSTLQILKMCVKEVTRETVPNVEAKIKYTDLLDIKHK